MQEQQGNNEQETAFNLDLNQDLIDKFHRDLYLVGGSDAFAIDEKDSFWVILQGSLNLFAVVMQGDKTVSARHFMLHVSAGETIFTLDRHWLDKKAGLYRQIIAVPNLDTKLYKGAFNELSGDENMFQTLSWIENWAHKLDGALSRFFHARPQAKLLEAEPQQKVEAEGWISGHHNVIIWVEIESGSAIYGSQDGYAFDTGKARLPLSEVSVVYCSENCTFNGSLSVTEHVNGRLMDNLRHFNHFLMSALSHCLDEEERQHDLRVQRLRSDVEAKGSAALRTVGSVYSDIPEKGASSDAETALPPDVEVWCIALEHLGLHLPRNLIRSQFVENEEDIFNIVSLCGARYRKIRILEDAWYKRDRGTFISMTIRDKEPVVLIPEKGGRYRIINPGKNTNKLVEFKDSKSIATSGFMVYKPMPEKIEGWKTIMRFSFEDIMRDMHMVIFIAILIGLLGILSPYFTGEILSNYLPANDLSLFAWALIALAIAAVSRSLLGLANTFAVMRIIGNMTNTVQSAVWIRMLNLPAHFYRQFTAGDLADRANGINSIRETLTQSIFGSLLSVVSGTISILLMFYYSWMMTVFSLFLLAILVAVTFFFTRMQLPHQRKAFMMQGKIEGFIYQMLSGISKIRLLNAENSCMQRWASNYKGQKQHQYKAGMWNVAQSVFDSIAVPAMDLALFTFVLFVLLKGEYQPDFDIGDFLAFHVAFGQFSGSILALATAFSTVIESVPLYERVRPVLEAESEYSAGRPDIGTLRGKIQFSNVNFSYHQGEALVLQRLSFTIQPGEYVALVGTSGSGKSTISRLLLGFEKPNSGSVLIDNHDLNDVDIRSVRRQMSTVLQTSHIMQGNIFDNITAGRNHLTMDHVWLAAEKAGLKDDIEKLPMGLHTVIAEGGVGLSGGQRQRLLIARALIEPAGIVLFDEATSALDNITQAIVQKSLNSVNATRIVIAHRISTVRDVDRILVLDAGQIIESGSYKELEEKGGLFSELVKRQTFKD